MHLNLWNCSTALLLAGVGTVGLLWLGPTPLHAGLVAILQLLVLLFLRIIADDG